MMEDIVFDFKNVPASWQLCFLSEGPRKDECLRQLAFRHLPAQQVFGPAIYPNVEIGEKGCRFFAVGQPRRMAWGFNTLFAEVKQKDVSGLRNAMKQYLGGHSNYYRYSRGERLLSTEQQEWIINLFRRFGYTDGLTFDHYARVYDFEH